jgi:hypothetical protein
MCTWNVLIVVPASLNIRARPAPGGGETCRMCGRRDYHRNDAAAAVPRSNGDRPAAVCATLTAASAPVPGGAGPHQPQPPPPGKGGEAGQRDGRQPLAHAVAGRPTPWPIIQPPTPCGTSRITSPARMATAIDGAKEGERQHRQRHDDRDGDRYRGRAHQEQRGAQGGGEVEVGGHPAPALYGDPGDLGGLGHRERAQQGQRVRPVTRGPGLWRDSAALS